MSKITQVDVFPTAIGLREKFVIGTGFVGDPDAAGHHIFVKITTDDGYFGWGEQRALPSWSYETAESITSTIRYHLAPLLIGRDALALNEIHRAMDGALKPAVSNGHPFAKAAVDIALHDLAGRMLDLPIHLLLGGKRCDEIPLCYAVSIDTPDVMALKAEALQPCNCFKVKIAGEPDADEDRVRAIHDAVPDAKLWLDANQSYIPSRVIELLDGVSDIREVHCLEQPVPSQDWFGLRRVREGSRLPVAIDEGCFSSFDLAKVARLECADAVVLKICKSGGVRECLKSAHVAEANSLELLGSGLTEAGIGFAATIHLFSTLNLVLPPELNGPVFLESMAVSGLEIQDGIVTVPDGPGLGVTPDEDYMMAHPLSLQI